MFSCNSRQSAGYLLELEYHGQEHYLHANLFKYVHEIFLSIVVSCVNCFPLSVPVVHINACFSQSTVPHFSLGACHFKLYPTKTTLYPQVWAKSSYLHGRSSNTIRHYRALSFIIIRSTSDLTSKSHHAPTSLDQSH